MLEDGRREREDTKRSTGREEEDGEEEEEDEGEDDEEDRDCRADEPCCAHILITVHADHAAAGKEDEGEEEAAGLPTVEREELLRELC